MIKKYRVYSEKNGMEYFDLCDLYWRGEDGGDCDFPEGKEVMEYIRRKDKKGEVLYTKDIVMWDEPGFAGKCGPGVIGWFDWPGISGFAILDEKGNLHKDGGYGYAVGFEFETYAEKIGNICENSHLMKAKRRRR